MQFRAKEENQGYDLTPEFFDSFLEMGIEQFFGITVDIDEQKIVCDDQNPSAFNSWKDKQKN